MQRHRPRRRAAAFAPLAAHASALALASRAGGREPVHMGVNAWPPSEIWCVATARGLFGDQPVEIKRLSTWTGNMRSLPLGGIDLTHSSDFNAMPCLGKGKKGRVVLKGDAMIGGDGLAIRAGLSGKDLRA